MITGEEAPHAEPSPEARRSLEFNKTAGLIQELIARGYSEHSNLLRLKEQIEGELASQRSMGTLTPEMRDDLLDTYSIVSSLLNNIENSA
jgi:hypothetical protein